MLPPAAKPVCNCHIYSESLSACTGSCYCVDITTRMLYLKFVYVDLALLPGSTDFGLTFYTTNTFTLQNKAMSETSITPINSFPNSHTLRFHSRLQARWGVRVWDWGSAPLHSGSTWLYTALFSTLPVVYLVLLHGHILNLSTMAITSSAYTSTVCPKTITALSGSIRIYCTPLDSALAQHGFTYLYCILWRKVKRAIVEWHTIK